MGKRAASGLAAGPIAWLQSAAAARRGRGDAAAEATSLRGAIAAARFQLAELARRAPGEGADILEFQIAMLEDETLSEPAFAAIAAGSAAEQAWGTAVRAQVNDYEAAQDDSFRARASDLRDIGERVLRSLTGDVEEREVASGSIVLAEELTPSRFLAIDWSKGGGIALTRGSPSGHVATLARARGVPMVVGIEADLEQIAGHAEALLDGESGALYLDPSPATRDAFSAHADASRRRRSAAEIFEKRPAMTRDGIRVTVLVNLADVGELDALNPAACDGVGLVRTEFLFRDADDLMDEEAQHRAYRRIAEWAAGKPVTVRTLDAGGDKPIPGYTIDGESNPFLGTRGVRLSLAKPEEFRIQLRALARAASMGAIEVMLPMVAAPRELAVARRWLDQEIERLAASGAAFGRPPLGIMVEVPAAALAIERFDADFFSIGSNDLTQYVFAAARDSDALAALTDPTDPAVLRLIAAVAAHGARQGKKVSLCGDAAGEPRHVGALLRAGLRSLSVAPSALASVKEAIAAVRLDQAA